MCKPVLFSAAYKLSGNRRRLGNFKFKLIFELFNFQLFELDVRMLHPHPHYARRSLINTFALTLSLSPTDKYLRPHPHTSPVPSVFTEAFTMINLKFEMKVGDLNSSFKFYTYEKPLACRRCE
jgi:hypothetical protein